jgi:hypothetical protein
MEVDVKSLLEQKNQTRQNLSLLFNRLEQQRQEVIGEINLLSGEIRLLEGLMNPKKEEGNVGQGQEPIQFPLPEATKGN